eukprot:g6140.t1
MSCARIGHTAGVDHDYTRVALAAIVDAIGRRICSGSKLCLRFGRVGSLVAKDRCLRFVFAEQFRRPTTNSAGLQDKYGNDVRRILATLEAKQKECPASGSLASLARSITTRPETCLQRVAEGRQARARTAGGAVGSANVEGTPRCQTSLSTNAGGVSSRRGNGTLSEPRLLVSVRSSAPSGAGRASSASLAHVCPRRQGALVGRGAVLEGPETPTPRATIAGAAAMVAGGRRPRDEATTQAAQKTAAGAKEGAGVDGGDISPRTAKKVLPHFLAIGNPGSQALVAKEGAEIVQQQARERFARLKAVNIQLDEKEVDETKKRQHAKWKEYEARQTEERKRLRDYLVAVKEQAESQKAARANKRSGEFMEDNSDPGRAYPCRIEYDIVKEQAWRKAWCEDLEKQIELKRRLEEGIRNAEASRDRVRAAQLDAAVKADRRREMEVKRLDRERISKAWEAQVLSFARPEGGGRRERSIILDKIVQ